jgi:hypothetical protein
VFVFIVVGYGENIKYDSKPEAMQRMEEIP